MASAALWGTGTAEGGPSGHDARAAVMRNYIQSRSYCHVPSYAALRELPRVAYRGLWRGGARGSGRIPLWLFSNTVVDLVRRLRSDVRSFFVRSFVRSFVLHVSCEQLIWVHVDANAPPTATPPMSPHGTGRAAATPGGTPVSPLGSGTSTPPQSFPMGTSRLASTST